MKTNPQQFLPKPPKVDLAKGYNWREFDRYLQQLHAMLGLKVGVDSFNVWDAMDMDMALAATDNSSINSGDSPEMMLTNSSTTRNDTDIDDLMTVFIMEVI